MTRLKPSLAAFAVQKPQEAFRCLQGYGLQPAHCSRRIINLSENSLVERLSDVEEVGRMYLKGYSTPMMARTMGVSSREINNIIRDWKALVRKQAETASDVKDKVMDILFESEQHFELIRKEAWETVEQADNAGQLSTKVNALKLASSITKDIVNMFESSGINSDTNLIEELNERERNEKVLIELLRDIRAEHPQVADAIARRLGQIGEPVESSSVEIESVERE